VIRAIEEDRLALGEKEGRPRGRLRGWIRGLGGQAAIEAPRGDLVRRKEHPVVLRVSCGRRLEAFHRVSDDDDGGSFVSARFLIGA
jgi:hypothetical protein